MRKFLKKILLGVTLPQEFLCINQAEFKNALRFYLVYPSLDPVVDLTESHLFIGYKPLILAIDKSNIDNTLFDANLNFSFRTNDNTEVGSLKAKIIDEKKINTTSVIICEGIRASNQLINNFNKFCGTLYYNLSAKKSQNVFLAGNLYEQVKLAYSIPRKIYLASVGSGSKFNIFPTDLSGKIGKSDFIISLRKGGRANEQILKTGKCSVSVMQAECFEEVYRAGKNHMKDLSEIMNFDVRFRDQKSILLNNPVPNGVVNYYELESTGMLEIGIHTIHILRILNSVKLSDEHSILAHIHRDYAEWRIRNGIETNFLLRKN